MQTGRGGGEGCKGCKSVSPFPGRVPVGNESLAAQGAADGTGRDGGALAFVMFWCLCVDVQSHAFTTWHFAI